MKRYNISYRIKGAVLFSFLAAAAAVTSCGDDELGATIFDTTDYPLDRSDYTFPLDTFIKVNFLEPYNLRYVYKMEDIGSDLQKNLVPASYENSVKLAVLSKYLWYDVYKEKVSELFLKIYSPRIIHVIGSPAYNPSSGTETLGTAEGGLKITIYAANQISENDLDFMNERCFKTMHHEFGHILEQTHLRPTSFNTISSSYYNAIDWQNTSDSIAASQGFVSDYASSQAREDWVEVMANYIVKDSTTWYGLLNTAFYDWEKTTMSADSFSMFEKRMAQGKAIRDTIGYLNDKDPVASTNGTTGSPEQYNIIRRVVSRNADGTVALVDGKIQYLDSNGIDGRSVILEKLDMVRSWLSDNFNVNIDTIRAEVQRRQYVTTSGGGYVNRLTYDDGSGQTLIERLLLEVERYKSLMQ